MYAHTFRDPALPVKRAKAQIIKSTCIVSKNPSRLVESMNDKNVLMQEEPSKSSENPIVICSRGTTYTIDRLPNLAQRLADQPHDRDTVVENPYKGRAIAPPGGRSSLSLGGGGRLVVKHVRPSLSEQLAAIGAKAEALTMDIRLKGRNFQA